MMSYGVGMNKKGKKFSISYKQLTHSMPQSWLPFTTTADLPKSRGLVGQERAMTAVEIGLRIDARGFHIFAVGGPGSGKTTTLTRILKERASAEAVPSDLLYVYNFNTPDRPRPLFMPAGQGRQLASDMDRLVDELVQTVPRVLSEKSFGHMRTSILSNIRRKLDDLTKKASKAAKKLSLMIEEDEDSLRVIPLRGSEPLDADEFEQLDRRTQRKIEANMIAFQEHLDLYSYKRRQLERTFKDNLLEAEMRAITPLVEETFKEIDNRYAKCEHGLLAFLDESKKHILKNHRDFLPADEDEDSDESETSRTDAYRKYKVNVVVDRTGERGAPVVSERVPTPGNICGYFEHREAPGGLVTDHMMIRSGALHQANGGYLLLQASDLLSHERSWDNLKRSLRHREVQIDGGPGAAEGRPRVAGMMKPGTAPIDLKTILIGNADIFYFLLAEDEDFRRLFKIKAHFEPVLERTRENVMKLAGFLGQVCLEEGLLPLHRTGMVRVTEYASRLAGHKDRMTNERAALLDLVAEANLFAGERRARAIRDLDVERAFGNAQRREGAIPDAVHREIQEGSILIRTKGAAVGQLNGIALYDIAGNAFGIPVRITARTYAGQRGVVNIDREVDLSGAVHDKGSMIMIGYLGGRYAKKQTLALSASITFEQSYDEIDGDSASSAELYALLSSLSGCPIRQGIAVTGSVNQLGEIQPIGGVNEKIEGIFRLCRDRGLTGEQGVMIPQTNIKNLMLGREVIDAVRAGRFSIYAVGTVDEGIEVLTGIPAGRRLKKGCFTAGSINDLVEQQLRELQQVIQDSGVPTVLDKKL
jgi:lon-related putative ATP-dependent protease